MRLTLKFWPPSTPVRLECPARFTSEAICLQASEMEAINVAISLSTVPFASSCKVPRSSKEPEMTAVPGPT